MRYRFTLRLFLFGFGFLFCLSSAFGQSEESETDDAVLAGHSYHGEAFNEGPRQQAYLMEGLGRSSFPVSTYSPLAQQFFNQGIDQLHGFWYFEAERSFRQVLILDPDCAMACWGLAMANINNPERARQFIEQARDKAGEAEGRVTDLEQMWIDCLADYYDSEKGDKKKRSRELIEGLEKIIIKYPDNIEAKAFLALMELNGWTGKQRFWPARFGRTNKRACRLPVTSVSTRCWTTCLPQIPCTPPITIESICGITGTPNKPLNHPLWGARPCQPLPTCGICPGTFTRG